MLWPRKFTFRLASILEIVTTMDNSGTDTRQELAEMKERVTNLEKTVAIIQGKLPPRFPTEED